MTFIWLRVKVDENIPQKKRQRPILFKRVQNDQWTQWNRTIDQPDMHGVMFENIRSERLIVTPDRNIRSCN